MDARLPRCPAPKGGPPLPHCPAAAGTSTASPVAAVCGTLRAGSPSAVAPPRTSLPRCRRPLRLRPSPSHGSCTSVVLQEPQHELCLLSIYCFVAKNVMQERGSETLYLLFGFCDPQPILKVLRLRWATVVSMVQSADLLSLCKFGSFYRILAKLGYDNCPVVFASPTFPFVVLT
ncbi:unnamed protein product [Miscanthus lutarioriparius]|uniref:Uncharacterized protein n=1 Tax=Miscanthus lutarioriparius TaxID=422564 RepID=A0A811S7U2_9POAL|nr:unnamed protein product [Miscanthus lutarioriparius]